MTRPSFKRLLNPSLLGAGAALLATLAVAIGTVWYVVAHLLGPTSPAPTAQPSAPQPNSDRGSTLGLTVPNFEWKTVPEGRNLAGIVKNQSNRSYTYVKVEFDLLDEQGKKVGDAMGIVSSLNPQKTGEFEAPVVFDRAKKAQIKAIRGF